MSTSVEGKEVRVVRGTQPASTTAQTRGMERRPGIDAQTTGAKRVWLGLVTCAPNTEGPAHHHGEAETAAYVISGHVRVYYGEGFRDYIDGGPGDFIFVPPYLHHIEANVTDEPAEAVLSRAPDNIVVNLEE
jgi:uncharacterized RmlC-like cupin family protein